MKSGVKQPLIQFQALLHLQQHPDPPGRRLQGQSTNHSGHGVLVFCDSPTSHVLQIVPSFGRVLSSDCCVHHGVVSHTAGKTSRDQRKHLLSSPQISTRSTRFQRGVVRYAIQHLLPLIVPHDLQSSPKIEGIPASGQHLVDNQDIDKFRTIFLHSVHDLNRSVDIAPPGMDTENSHISPDMRLGDLFQLCEKLDGTLGLVGMRRKSNQARQCRL
mmetsp:Transcript_7975/g.18822  ORF Transcript_7975/g.18822 Transcript_7975/m.18822 type:complete len:215 (-) Transcript_7975:746-1390(-)